MTDKFTVKFCKRVNGEGLFTNSFIKKYNIVRLLEGPIKDVPDKYSIEIGTNRHITDKLGIYMNHSFQPSVFINGVEVVALKDIDIGEEICFNYNKNETSMACPFETPNGIVNGYDSK